MDLVTGVRMLRDTYLLVRCTFALERREHRFFAANHKSMSKSKDVRRFALKTYQKLKEFLNLQFSRISYGDLHFHYPNA